MDVDKTEKEKIYLQQIEVNYLSCKIDYRMKKKSVKVKRAVK